MTSYNYKEIFQTLDSFFPTIVEDLKKELKKGHLKNDRLFYQKHFGSKPANRLETSEIAEAYRSAITEDPNDFGALFLTSWLQRHENLYNFFYTQLIKINPDVEAIKEIDSEIAETIIRESIEQFGAERSYIFAVMNAVSFKAEDLNTLAEKAKVEAEENNQARDEKELRKAFDAYKRMHEREMRQQKNRYEKQIRQLEKKLATAGV